MESGISPPNLSGIKGTYYASWLVSFIQNRWKKTLNFIFIHCRYESIIDRSNQQQRYFIYIYI
jgi:hypothetical protein